MQFERFQFKHYSFRKKKNFLRRKRYVLKTKRGTITCSEHYWYYYKNILQLSVCRVSFLTAHNFHPHYALVLDRPQIAGEHGERDSKTFLRVRILQQILSGDRK